MHKTLPSLLSIVVQVTATTLVYVILLIRCGVEHTLELVVVLMRIPGCVYFGRKHTVDTKKTL